MKHTWNGAFCKFGARHLTRRKSHGLFHFFPSCPGRPVFCVGDAANVRQNGQMTSNDKKFVACNILNLVPSCSSLLSRVQVSCSTFEEDSEAGDSAFEPPARMPPTSLLLVQSIACCFICRIENLVIRTQALSNFRYNTATGFWSSQC